MYDVFIWLGIDIGQIGRIRADLNKDPLTKKIYEELGLELNGR